MRKLGIFIVKKSLVFIVGAMITGSPAFAQWVPTGGSGGGTGSGTVTSVSAGTQTTVTGSATVNPTVNVQYGTSATQTAAFSAVVGQFYKVSTAGSSFAVTLPDATTATDAGASIAVALVTAGNALTVATTGGQTVGGNASGALSVSTAGQMLVFYSDGANWQYLVTSVGSGSGTVTSVGMTGDGVVLAATVPGSPITGSGTLLPGPATIAAHKYLGNNTGTSATIAAQSIGTGDLPQIPLTTGVTGVLPVANGGTNTGTAPSSAQILVAQNSTTYAPETLSGDVSVATSGASTIANNAVTNAKAAQGAALTMKGNLTNASANLTDNALAPNQFHVCNNAGTAIVAAAMSGDVSNSAGAVTLATVNSNVGSFTNANITVNGKGLVTAASNGSGGGGLPSGVNPQTVYYATSGTTGTAVYASQIALLGTGADGATTYSTTATLTKPVYNQTAVKINSGVTMTVSGPTLIVASGAAQIGVSTFDIEGSLVGDGLGGNAGKLGASIFQLPGGPCPGQSNIYAQNSGSSPAGAGGGCGGYGGGSGSGSAEVAGGASLCANTSTFYPPPGAQGSGGGYGGQYNAPVNGGAGGAAIRIVVGHNSAATNDFINNGTISAVGLPGSNGGANSVGGGGGGSGGIATIYGVLSAILNNAASVTLTGGAGGVGGIASDAGNGGGGGGGGIYSMISTGARTLGTSTLTGGAGGTVLGTGTAGSAGSAGFAFSIAEDPTIPLIGWYDTHVRDVANLLHRPEGSTICMKDGELMNLMAAHIAATEHKDYGVVLSWLREQNPADALTATQDQLDHALDNVKTLAPQVEPCDLETSLLPAA